jgi:hypothetical protein
MQYYNRLVGVVCDIFYHFSVLLLGTVLQFFIAFVRIHVVFNVINLVIVVLTIP